MTWIRLDDQFSKHPKVVQLSDGAFRLLVDSFCYCGQWNTDGRIPKGALKMRLKYVRELVSRGNWHANGHTCESCPEVAKGDYYAHDFLVYNPSAEEVEESQGRRSEKARRAARARWDRPPSTPNGNAESIATSMPGAMPDELLGECSSDAPVPDPLVVTSLPGTWEPPHPQAVDDDDEFVETPTEIDPLSITIRAVFERCAEAKTKGITPNNPAAYRDRVLANLELEHGDRLRKAIETHPGAPVDVLAGWVLGEPNSLASYQVVAS